MQYLYEAENDQTISRRIRDRNAAKRARGLPIRRPYGMSNKAGKLVSNPAEKIAKLLNKYLWLGVKCTMQGFAPQTNSFIFEFHG